MTKKIFSFRTAWRVFQMLFIVLLGMVAGALWRMEHPESRGAVVTDFTNVKVSARRDGVKTHFIVENQERSEVTMTFDFSLVNLRGDVQFPYTATFLPGETEAFTLVPNDPEQQWEYSYTNYHKLGSSTAIPDNYIYSLPYAPGSTRKVTQAYGGSYSHKGSNKYAIDWKMPEGTPVYAARGGLVVKVKDDSDKGGGSMAYDRYNNYVLIRHDDGTLGHYCHLKQGGVRVTPGERVHVGDLLALSGNTGFSSGPHLHFCVFKAVSGRERESLPVLFKDANEQAVTLVEGEKYRAPEFEKPAPVQSAAAKSDTVVR